MSFHVAHVIGADDHATLNFVLETDVQLQRSRRAVIGSEQTDGRVEARRQLRANEGRIRVGQTEWSIGLIGILEGCQGRGGIGNSIVAIATIGAIRVVSFHGVYGDVSDGRRYWYR